MQTCHQISLSASHFSLLLTFGEEKMKENMLLIKTVVRPAIQKTKYLTSKFYQSPFTASNVIHRQKNSEDSLRIACLSPISH